ncbi:MAG: hypothetical protein KDC33_10875 [Thermoleophilia bacterium]|nr:hypothetical protein [Thermoleophilia bacterium]
MILLGLDDPIMPSAGAYAASVTRAPAILTDTADVALDADPEVVYEAVPWMPRGTALPTVGASCLVVFDDRGNPWMPVWRPA